MIADSALYDLPVEFHLILWGSAIGCVSLGFALSLAVSRPDLRIGRALHAAGPLLALMAAALLLPRIVQVLHPVIGWGPQSWLPAAVNAVLPDQLKTSLHPYDTAVVLHVAFALAVIPGLPIISLIQRLWSPKPSRPLPLAVASSIVLGVAAVAIPYFAQRGLGAPIQVGGLEWLAAAPLMALLLAMRLNASWPSDKAVHQSTDTQLEERSLPDIPSLWIAAGVLDGDAMPQVSLQAQAPPPDASPSAPEHVARAWAATGVEGPPLGVLSDLIDADEVVALLVGDLPHHAERALLDAFFAHHVGVGGARILALVEDPAHSKARLQQTLERVHTWEPGAITAGAAALTEALARQQIPALAFVTLDELDSALVPLASREGKDWAGSLSWLVLHHPQKGSPLEVTHSAFALKRWIMATSGMADCSVVVTGPDTPAMLGFIDSVLPGRSVRRCGPQAAARGAVTVWPASTDRSSAADPWSARAAHAVASQGVAVQLFDRHLDALTHQHASVTRSNKIDVVGPASVATLEGHELSQAWRVAHFRLPEAAAPTHQALWHVQPSPLGYFLATPGRLAALHERRELPVPKPVVGTANRFLRLAHLRAALEDGHTDERSLRVSFGDDVVDFAMSEVEPTGRWIARVRGGVVERSPVLRGPRGVDAPEPGRQALTAQRIRIVEERSGLVLAEVDELVAATRYHPKRVFESNGRRYRVPLHAIDTKRGQLRVVAADPRDAITAPLLRVQVEPLRIEVDSVTRNQGGLSVTTMTIAALITEEVSGAWVPGEDQRETFDPVRSRYDSSVRLIMPTNAAPGPGLGHLAGMIASLMPAHLAVGQADIEVAVVGRGLMPDLGPGIAVVDRHVGGLGVAAALDDGTVIEVLRWVRAVLYACPCDVGCARCTPEKVLRAGPDKAAVLRMLPVQG